jgi:exosome complex component MTR3
MVQAVGRYLQYLHQPSQTQKFHRHNVHHERGNQTSFEKYVRASKLDHLGCGYLIYFDLVLKTGVTPSASGSAYLELESPPQPKLKNQTFLPPSSTLKISCTVHGPRPLPRSAPFNSSLLLTTHIKFAPFAARHRRGYVRDSTERDLGAHLETALRGVIIGDRWPKSGVDVVITVLEGEEDRWCGEEASGGTTGIGAVGGWGMMNVLAGCITVSSAAIVDAGIDCVDLVTGGVAAVVEKPSMAVKTKAETEDGGTLTILDPSPPEHAEIRAACVVAYLAERDEITEMWLRGDAGISAEALVDKAVAAAAATRSLLVETVMETAKVKFPELASKSGPEVGDVDMTG